MGQSSATFYMDPPRRKRRRAQLPRGMREERERLQARRDRVARVLEFGRYYLARAIVARYAAELDALDKRLSGFDALGTGARAPRIEPRPSWLTRSLLRSVRPHGRGPERLRRLECRLHPRVDLARCSWCRQVVCTGCHPDRCDHCGHVLESSP
jgi:hypothetical protein